jgi:hypothetical protein
VAQPRDLPQGQVVEQHQLLDLPEHPPHHPQKPLDPASPTDRPQPAQHPQIPLQPLDPRPHQARLANHAQLDHALDPNQIAIRHLQALLVLGAVVQELAGFVQVGGGAPELGVF